LITVQQEACATLQGWRRSFCLRSTMGRGSPDRPGRMLSLLPGGQTQGVALRLPADAAVQELKLLWAREMTMGSYRPCWVQIDLHGRAEEPSQAHAIVFVANPEHPQHQADDSPHTVAQDVAQACGAFGRNIDYLNALHQALGRRGLHDGYIDAIVQAIATGTGQR
jgi:cation transport protein ChaC